MKKIFDVYFARKGIDPQTMRLTFDGIRVTPESTPKMLEMEDGDQIDASLVQTGGYH